jgi:hypothetical protein
MFRKSVAVAATALIAMSGYVGRPAPVKTAAQ